MEMTEQMKALTGAAESAAGAGGEDWKAKCESLQRELASAKVEQGRVKKLDERVKELEAELKSRNAGRTREELLASLSEETRENVAPEVQAAAAEIAAAALAREREANEARFAQLESERAAASKMQAESEQRAFMARIDSAFPGFLSSVGPGGTNAVAWTRYLQFNKGSVAGALAACDFPTIEYHIKQFCQSIEIPVPSADGGAAAPSDPGNQAGGAVPQQRFAQGKVYTGEEYDALDAKCEKLRREGRLDEYRQLRDELESALHEGRVKDA